MLEDQIDDVAYGEGVRICAEGGDKAAVHRIYINPASNIVMSFYLGFDAQLSAQNSGESLY